jgi:hypothetical protein
VLGPKTPAPESANQGPATPPSEVSGWRVETAHGRSLQAPDLATLHRWIIERRVTREDRISQDGQSWQRVGDMPDLAPFFDIVDSAERARRADTPGPMPLPAPPPSAAQPAPQIGPVILDRGAFPEVEDRTETKVLRMQVSALPLALKLGLTVVVAGLVAFAGIALYNWRSLVGAPAPVVVPPATENLPTSKPEPAPAQPVVVEETAQPEASEPPETETEAGSENRASPDKTRKRARPAPRGAVARAAKAAAAHHPAPVAGATTPGAPQAMAAQGYAALNRRQFDQAIAHFKQALAGNPSNGTALFGLAEAYRETGQKALALKSYRRYIQLLPSGPDAGSARLQIRLLESKR